MNKKWLLLLLLPLITIITMSSIPYEPYDNYKIVDKTFRIGASGGSSDTLLFDFTKYMDVDNDTLSFILELMDCDSLGSSTITATSTTFCLNPSVITENSEDSLEIIGVLQPVSPSKLTEDTLTFTGLYSNYKAFHKYNNTGRVVFGPKVNLPVGCGAAKLWVKVINFYNSAQDVHIRIWRVRR